VHEDSPGTNHILTSTRLSCLARPSSVLLHIAWLQADGIAHFMQVGLKTQYQGSQGQIMFFLGNKHAAPLERIIFVVPPQPQFQFQLASVPQRLEAKQQVQVSPRCCSQGHCRFEDITLCVQTASDRHELPPSSKSCSLLSQCTAAERVAMRCHWHMQHHWENRMLMACIAAAQCLQCVSQCMTFTLNVGSGCCRWH